MDLIEAIRQLTVEKQRVERAIAQLEELQKTDSGGGGRLLEGRRGRKSMSLHERKEVSEYWQNRRPLRSA